MRLYLLALALAVLIALAVGALAVSPESQDPTVVQRDVRRANDALYSGDIDTLLRYTHPRIIELMGGKDRARETLKESLKIVSEMRVEKLSFPDAPRFSKGRITSLCSFRLSRSSCLRANVSRASIFSLG